VHIEKGSHQIAWMYFFEKLMEWRCGHEGRKEEEAEWRKFKIWYEPHHIMPLNYASETCRVKHIGNHVDDHMEISLISYGDVVISVTTRY
jgi:hypothetical protein